MAKKKEKKKKKKPKKEKKIVRNVSGSSINFIDIYKMDESLCDKLIIYFKKNKEYKHIGVVGRDRTVNKSIKDSMDVHFYNDSNNEYIKTFFKELSKHLKSYMQKYKIMDSVNTNVCNNIQYYKPKGGYPSLHYERGPAGESLSRQLTYVLYLNTVTDKGGTEFPYQNVSTQAIKGNLIIFPAEFTHPHRGIISNTQEKYIATGWIGMI